MCGVSPEFSVTLVADITRVVSLVRSTLPGLGYGVNKKSRKRSLFYFPTVTVDYRGTDLKFFSDLRSAPTAPSKQVDLCADLAGPVIWRSVAHFNALDANDVFGHFERFGNGPDCLPVFDSLTNSSLKRKWNHAGGLAVIGGIVNRNARTLAPRKTGDDNHQHQRDNEHRPRLDAAWFLGCVLDRVHQRPQLARLTSSG
jgi:hypothetical protein